MSHLPGVLVLVPRFQLVLSPPLPCTNGGQGLCHLLIVAELLARCGILSMFWVYCVTIMICLRGVRTKTVSLHVCFFFFFLF